MVVLIILSLAAWGCSSTPRVKRTTSSTKNINAHQVLSDSYASESLAPDRRLVLQEAERWLGTPYKYAGRTRDGTDCSGFVISVFGIAHRMLPRSSSEQAGAGTSIDLADALPADLVFFNTSGSGVSHVGILVNHDLFIHSSTSLGVIVSSLNEAYYKDRLMFARRVLP